MPAILYVDDDEDNLIVFEALCSKHFTIFTAGSGAEALAMLRTHEISVLLADQRMPGMTGIELAERVADTHPDVVRILITAYSELSEAIDAINRGQVRGYLRKPWDADELLAILREALATYATRKRVRQLEVHMRDTERVYTTGVVAAGIAHEMKSPLRALADGIAIVRDRLGEASALARAGENDRAGALIDSLRPFVDAQATSTATMEELCRGFEVSNYSMDADERCNMADVADVAARLVMTSKDHSIDLDVECDDVPDVRGNRHRLGRVLINILINAFESVAATPNPRVTLRVCAAEEKGADHVLVDIRDNGPGMPPEVQERVFDAFYSTKENGGTGLGLAISKQIVEQVGGTVICQSTEGSGTLFRITLHAG